MKPEEVFKRYDIRGRYPEELNEKFAEIIGKALGTFTAREFEGKIVVCRDNKESSEQLKQALINGIRSTGVDVLDVGVGPTDYAAWAGKNNDSFSVQVTSSHMPLEFNGFKFMYPQGNSFVNEDLHTVQDLFRGREFHEGKGRYESKDMIETYKKEIINFASNFKEGSEKKIIYESLGGTGDILPEILERQGHTVKDISKQKKPYIDPPNPKPENLKRLAKRVNKSEADLGLSHDLDGDRVTVYFKNCFLTGDEVFCLLAQLVDTNIVASIDTSKSLESFGEVDYTRVGDPFVLNEALKTNAGLAGEPNGHYSFTEFVPYNSGVLTGLIISNLDIGKRLKRIPEYFVERESIQVDDKDQVIEALKDKKEVLSELDGVKFREKGADVLVRPSGSSSKVRIISQSKEKDSAVDALGNISRFVEDF